MRNPNSTYLFQDDGNSASTDNVWETLYSDGNKFTVPQLFLKIDFAMNGGMYVDQVSGTCISLTNGNPTSCGI